MLFRQFFDDLSCTFTYLIGSETSREAVIIDPVLENVDEYLLELNKLNLGLIKVIETHTHADHFSGSFKLKDKTNCKTLMGEHTKTEVVEIRVKDEEIIKVGDLNIKAIHTPGHTLDSYSFLMKDRVFSGDTLLINGTGRTDFQEGSAKDSYESIFNRLLKLPEKTLLYPAHDYKGEKVSTIGKERKFNPRLQVKNMSEYLYIMNNLNLPKPKLIDVAVERNLKLGAL
mgnify:CR=1 FL=1|tara:strand:- start:1034 stop:1717 length:684 start_codon:yes stop_codon:yes gene_type:complete